MNDGEDVDNNNFDYDDVGENTMCTDYGWGDDIVDRVP